MSSSSQMETAVCASLNCTGVGCNGLARLMCPGHSTASYVGPGKADLAQSWQAYTAAGQERFADVLC